MLSCQVVTQLRPERDATDRADFLEKVDELVVQHFFFKDLLGQRFCGSVV